ncbi:MAG: Uma2 family endonuclease [Chloroflexota bacterium]|nr:Uma2 family endonuclease [Chloroflexota bacterium]
MTLEALVLPPVIPSRLPHLPTRKRAWPAQGEWTYEDYENLPDDGQRYEIIEGALYVAAAPNFHQYTVGEIFAALRTYVGEHELELVLVALFEVRLPGIALVVQPDVIFIPSEHTPHPGALRFTGAPDLVVEVLSHSTARTDKVVKFSAYERAGVREYWLVAPRVHSVEVYSLSGEGTLELAGQYTPGETVTSGVLSDLALSVDDLFVE